VAPLLLEGSCVAPRALRPLHTSLVRLDLRTAAIGGLWDGVYGWASIQEVNGLCGAPLLARALTSVGSVEDMELLAALKPQVVPSSML
jgi:hypothetical protein